MPKTARALTVHPVALREVEVIRITDITPGMRRITLSGDQLAAFTSPDGSEHAAFTSTGVDDDIRLLFPYPGDSEPDLPVHEDGKLQWPDDPRTLTRVYTVRSWDPDTHELDVDFVKHGTGIATTWAYRAQVGDRVHFVGPFSSRSIPTDPDWTLIAGDDTALPAIGRLLEELPEDTRGHAVIEVAEDSHRQELSAPAGVEITWLPRHGAPAATTTHLLDAVTSLDWPDGRVFAWLAGEQAVVRDLRRHLVKDREVPKSDISFSGYWKRSTVVASEDDAAVPDMDKTTPAFKKFHDLAELVPPIAIRVAAGLGLGELISTGTTSLPALAQASRADERALGKLLRYLQAIELVHRDSNGHYSLTEVGDFLANEFWAEHLNPAGPDGRREAGIFGLDASVRTGEASYESVTGRSFDEVRMDEGFQNELLENVASFAAFNAAPLAASGVLDGVRHLVIHSNGAVVQAREVTAEYPDLSVTICALPSQAQWFRRDLPETIADESARSRVRVVEQSIFEASPAADVVLHLMSLHGRPDADAVLALKRAAENLEPGGRVLLVDPTIDPAKPHDHDGEDDLCALTREGGGVRTDAELEAVVDTAGLVLTNARTIGWAATLLELAVS